MKKTYAAPAVVTNGTVIVDTKGSGGVTGDFSQQLIAPGSVGFNL